MELQEHRWRVLAGPQVRVLRGSGLSVHSGHWLSTGAAGITYSPHDELLRAQLVENFD